MELKSIGIGTNVEMAQAPDCDCGCGEKMSLEGKNFEDKKHCVGLAMNICDEWDCPHTFAFVKFNNGNCVGAFHLLKDSSLDDEINENYEWRIFEGKWMDKKMLRLIKENNLNSNIHFATVFEENKDGDFIVISHDDNKRKAHKIIDFSKFKN